MCCKRKTITNAQNFQTLLVSTEKENIPYLLSFIIDDMELY